MALAGIGAALAAGPTVAFAQRRAGAATRDPFESNIRRAPSLAPSSTSLTTAPTATIRLGKDFGLTAFYKSGIAAGTLIDCRGGRWVEANSRNPNPTKDYAVAHGSDPIQKRPFSIAKGGSGIVLLGGLIDGRVPQNSDWLYTYQDPPGTYAGLSTGVRIDSTPKCTIEGWRIRNTWDAIAIVDKSTPASHGWVLKRTHISGCRDDAIENDWSRSGTIEDVLIDGCHCGISTDRSSSTATGVGQHILFKGVLMRMHKKSVSLSWGGTPRVTHGPPLKCDLESTDINPDFTFIDCVIAVEDPNHLAFDRMVRGWKHTRKASNSFYLNLSDKAFPSNYPKPPAGFTILQGAEARSKWKAVKSAWLSRNPTLA